MSSKASPYYSSDGKSTIICGSKKYENINFNELVDSFDVIVRNNMLLPDNNYGKRNATCQVLNIHVYDHYKKKASPEEWISYYLELGLPEDHIRSFCEYIKRDDVKFGWFQDNNSGLMHRILKANNISYQTSDKARKGKQLRCGFGWIAHSINNGIKPFVIGLSLQAQDSLTKQNYVLSDGKKSNCHNLEEECSLIVKLHEANLIDATFCAIKDSQDLEVDDSLITPTAMSLGILEKVFE